MTTKTHEIYSVKCSNRDVSAVISRIERAVLGVDRDLIIVAALVLAIGLSDHDILKSDERLRSTLDSLSDHLCWLVGLSPEVKPEEAN